jgi:hypothetical protein
MKRFLVETAWTISGLFVTVAGLLALWVVIGFANDLLSRIF